MRLSPSIAFLFGTAMSLNAYAALAQPSPSLLRLEGEFLPYSASAPLENYDVVRSAAAFVPPGQRLRIEHNPSGDAQEYLWTWLPPLNVELCEQPFWKVHCAAVESGQPVSVPVRIITLRAEGTPESTTSQEFSDYWKLAVVGLRRGETVYRIQAELGGPDAWAYLTEAGYLGLTPHLLARFDPDHGWVWAHPRDKPQPSRGIQVLVRTR